MYAIVANMAAKGWLLVKTTDDKIRFIAFRRAMDGEVQAQDLFSALTGGGEIPGSVLLQSSDNIAKYGERSFAAVGASLRVEGRASQFHVTALDCRGRGVLPSVAARLRKVAEINSVDDASLTGSLEPDLRSVSGHDRPFRRNHMDVIRAVAFCGDGDGDGPLPTHGLFGCFAYSFIHQYEQLARNTYDDLCEPDYVFYLATRLFMIDHAKRRTHFVSSVPVSMGAELADELLIAERDVIRMVELAADPPTAKASLWHIGEIESDTNRETFCNRVEQVKRDIGEGRVFQSVIGRTFSTEFEGKPFDVYRSLSRLNPSPYMFYLRDEEGVLLAASPEMAVRVTREDEALRAEVRPIAGTKPRGFLNNLIDPLTDAKFETALKIDPKELAEHTMLVDLARNDLASVCRPGTTIVDEPFIVEKYSHVQHLVSNVTGLLREDLDALHAYLATMNMGTVTGAPKLEAMKMINDLENSARGYFGGSVGFISPDGQMDTALVIRAIRFKLGRAFVRAAAGIVADSVPESEWTETAHKAAACLRCLEAGA